MSSPDENPFERLARLRGETPAEVAALDRVFAGLRELAVARFNMEVAAADCAGAMRNFTAAWQASEERLTAAEALEVAGHPDLAEVNVRLDALYEQPR